jgi:polyribonucleotide nucleotidyltransferase
MIEGEAKEIPESKVKEALEFGHKALIPVSDIQNELRKEVGKPKAEVELVKPNKALLKKVQDMAHGRLTKIYNISDKLEREEDLHKLIAEVTADMTVFDEFKREGQAEVSETEIRRRHLNGWLHPSDDGVPEGGLYRIGLEANGGRGNDPY